MTRSKLLFTALTLCLAPACDERANIGERADAALPNDASASDASASDAGVPVDAPLSTDVPVRLDAPLPNVGFIDIVVGTVDVGGRASFSVFVVPRERVPETTPATVIESFGPCEARRAGETSTPAPVLNLGPVASARVGASGSFEPLGFVDADGSTSGFYVLTVTPDPPEGTPVTVRVDLGTRGVIERTLPVRTIRLTAPTRTPLFVGSVDWSAPYTPNSDFNVTWTTSERTGIVAFTALPSAGDTSIRCQLDVATNTFTLPWAQMNTYLVAPSSGAPRFQLSNVSPTTTTEAGVTVRANSSGQSGWTLLRP